MKRAGGLIVALLALAGSVQAQEAVRQAEIFADQLSAPRAGSLSAPSQISRGAPLSSGPSQPVDRMLPSVSAADRATRPGTEQQLTEEPSGANPGTQLTTGRPTAGPAPTAAHRAMGRITTVDRPQGDDRCDPRAVRGEAGICARVIETRAGDFPAPDPQPLSAEQRLLVAQRELNPQARDVTSATRRLADGNIDESNAGLAVASLTMGQTQRPSEDEEQPVDSSVTDAIVAGVLAVIGQTPTP